MGGARDCHTDWRKSGTETQISYNVPYTWNLKSDTSGLIFKGEIGSQTQNRFVGAKESQGGEGRRGSLGWVYVNCNI